MLHVEIIGGDGDTRTLQIPNEAVIGRAAQNEIRLDSWRVAKEHARLMRTPAGVLIEDMGAFTGLSVNGERVDGQAGPLKPSDEIGIGPFKLRVRAIGAGTDIVQAAHPDSRSSTAATRNLQASEALRASRLAAQQVQQAHERHVSAGHGMAAHGAAGHGVPEAEHVAAARAEGAGEPSIAVVAPGFALMVPENPKRKLLEFEWRRRLHGRLLETMDLRRHDVHSMSDVQLREQTERLVREIISAEDEAIPDELDRAALCKQVLDEAIGLGPLEELLADDGVSEVMVNRYDEIYIERSGRLQKHSLTFTGDRAVMGVIERIVAPLGRRIDESSPMVDARLKDGSRVNAIIPPLALKGPCLTIRKFAKRKLGADDLVRFGALSPAMAEFLELCVKARKNIVVAGGTGSGKTTLLNILSNFIPPGERVITIEDAAELKLHHEHLISLESRPANAEGKGAITIRDLVKNTLRMRPDRIVVGECRGAEALDMLQAMNTGHEGSLTTLHANTPRDALARLETMILMAGMELPLVAIREQIASAVDILVQQTRFSCGTRMVTSITELTGMESGKIQLQELFRFANHGYGSDGGKVRGFFTGCDMVPSFYEELAATGHAPDLAIFQPHDDPADAGEEA